MDTTEAVLELLLKKLQDQIENKIQSLNQHEISTMANKIPQYKTMLEFRQIRDRFLGKFNDPCPIPKGTSYSVELLRHSSDDCDLPEDTNSSLKDFFISEKKRIARIRDIVLARCTRPDFFSRTQMEFALFDKSISEYVFNCEEGLLRLDCKEHSGFATNDLMLELKTIFFQKRRTAFLRSLLLYVRRFPLTQQQSIFTLMFEYSTKSFIEDSKRLFVPILPRTESVMNVELQQLAKRLNMTQDLDANDGQQFLYHSQKKFMDMFGKLNFMDLPKKEYTFTHYTNQMSLVQLTQKSLLDVAPCDVKLTEVFDNIFSLNMEQVQEKINQKTAAYNSWVGNEYRSAHFHGDHTRYPIPLYKITSWYELRFIHTKFLAIAVLSYANYFQYIRSQLMSEKPNVMQSSGFQSRHSNFEQIIEICDQNGPFIFSSAIDHYQSIVRHLINIGSYYVARFEETASERQGDSTVVVDYESIAEKLLQYELEFLNAKRQVIQPLLECLEHKKCKKLIDMIYDVITERPKFNYPLYKSFDAPYRLSTELIKKKGEVIRTLLNFQILHERSLSSQFAEQIPFFDRPSQIPIDVKYRSFDESFPISPFEVYESVSDIYKFMDVVPKITKELGESIDIRLSKYGDYLEIAVWQEISDILKSIIDSGFFPFDRSATHFHFKLSERVNSLFVSPYVNTLEAIKDMISKMNESRQLRFLLSTRRFMHLTWKLQTLIIGTDLLQNAYYSQCDQLGITDKGIIMSSFKESAMKEIIDLHSEKFDLDLLDVALTEFETISLNFEHESSIKDVIFAADFSVLKRMIQFQNLQNTILEIAVRFNRHLLDSNFLVSYFEIGADSGMFLTGGADTFPMPDDSGYHIDGNENSEMTRRHIKQMIANRIFYQSSSIFRDNQQALKQKDLFHLSIKSIKSKSRTILSAHVKQKAMTHQEMFDLYLSEMVDAFAVFGFRVEIARICNLERHILLSNTFVDTFAMGPDPQNCLVNSQGHFEKFFYVPTWAECFTMLHTAPHARQGMVLKSVLEFIQSRFRILNLVRHECSLSQRIDIVFGTIYNQCFQCETPVFQQLFSEFSRLPNASEVEISTKYILEKEKFIFHRFEFSLLVSLETFFISLNLTSSDQNSESHDNFDTKFGESAQDLWTMMHMPLDKERYLITENRYVPLWQEQFAYKCLETDRADIVTRLSSTDVFLDGALSSMYSKEILDDPIQKLPLSIDFLCLTISQLHIKFAYFLLRDGNCDESEIDIRSSISKMDLEIYSRNCHSWDDVIVKQANEHLVPKDESPSRVTETIPEPKLAQSIFDVVRSQVDLMLLSSQIKQVEEMISNFNTDIKQLKEIVSSTSKINFPEISNCGSVLCMSLLKDEKDDNPFYVQNGQIYNDQFIQEKNYSHKRIVEDLHMYLKQSTISKDDESNEVLINQKDLLDSLLKLSFSFNNFGTLSIEQENETWKKYLTNVTISIGFDKDEMDSVSILANLAERRFARQTDSEIGNKFHSMFLTVNQLRQELRLKQQKEMQIEMGITRKLRDHYDTLVEDLENAIEKTKKMETGLKKKVYDGVMSKIKKAKGVALKARKIDDMSNVSRINLVTKINASSKANFNVGANFKPNISSNIKSNISSSATNSSHNSNNNSTSNIVYSNNSSSKVDFRVDSKLDSKVNLISSSSNNTSSVNINANINSNVNANIKTNDVPLEKNIVQSLGAPKLDKNFLSKIESKNANMKKEILILRCFRVLTQVAVNRHFDKVLKETEEERKSDNSNLWRNKLECELREARLEDTLYQKHHQLCNSTVEIDRFNQKLENEKMCSIQLVHWKAKNLKTIERIKLELDSFGEGIDDIDIDKVIKRLAEANEELDELREIGEEMTNITEEEIQKPMKTVEKIRSKVRESKLLKTKMIEMVNESQFQEKQANKESFVQKLSDENIQLRHANEILMQKIVDLESLKNRKSEHVRSLMEDTLKTRGQTLKMYNRTMGRIVKPDVRNVVRSLSRI